MILLEQLYLAAQNLHTDPSSQEILRKVIDSCKADFFHLHFSPVYPSYIEALGYRKPSQEEREACLNRWEMLEKLVLDQNAFQRKSEILSHILILITIHKELSRVRTFYERMPYRKHG